MPLPATFHRPDGGDVLLRRAQPEDAEAHVELWNAIGAERIYLMTERLARTVEEVRTQFRDADPLRTLWLVAEQDGQLVGGAGLQRGVWKKNEHTATLGIALRKEFRGRGIGEALLRSGLEWARSVGIRKVKLGVFATNDRAIALYRKLGFVEEARLRGEVILEGHPVDEVLMALWL